MFIDITQESTSGFFRFIPNHELPVIPNNLIASMSSLNKHHCLFICKSNPNCNSITLNAQNRNCTLFSNYPSSQFLIYSPGTNLYTRFRMQPSDSSS